MKIVKMVSANGGAEIEVSDDRVQHFEQKGWSLVKKTTAARQPKAPRAIATKEK